jgi:hypothetical protein
MLDLTLLHELTHTRPGRELDDVKVPNFLGIKSKAYGWDKAKVLAKRKPYVDKFADNACDKNADSIAYFALGILP